jgi:hypothetical protein
MNFKSPQIALVSLLAMACSMPVAVAQSVDARGVDESQTQILNKLFGVGNADVVTSFRIVPSASLIDAPLFRFDRSIEENYFQDTAVNDVLNFNLGMQIDPAPGLSVRANAWRLQVDEAPVKSVSSNVSNNNWQSASSQLYIQDSEISEFGLSNPLLGSNLKAQGFDIGASYEWDTSRFGQFTLSSKTTYVEDFENKGSLLQLSQGELSALNEAMVSPELQSSLMLSWQLGNHTASAITNYIDSFKEISELDIDEINELVDNITTVDLQYGYSVETGSNDRAIISFGIRNIFNEKNAQIFNSTTRILDQNGRVAYGSIKYQF